VVFDDPDKGLIALIGRVTSVDALRQCGQLMIRRLFTRKNDQLDVARFTKELEDIVPASAAAGDLQKIKSEVIRMLQRIKAIRVAKAREYLEKKAKDKEANRRSAGSKAADTYKVLNHPKLVPIAVVGLLALIALLVAFVYFTAFHDSSTNLTAERERENAIAAADAEQQRLASDQDKQKLQQEKREQAEKQKTLEAKRKRDRIMPAAIVMPGVYIQQEVKGVSRNAKLVMPIFILDDRKNLSQICEMRPKIIDTINITLSKSITATEQGGGANFDKIAATIRRQVNDYLQNDTVVNVRLVTDGKTRDMATAGDRCTLASERYFDYIYPPSTK